MSIPFPPKHPTFPASPQANSPSSPGCCPPYSATCARPPLDSVTSPTSDYGYKRFVPFLSSPPVGAGILACIFFSFIVFFTNLLANVTALTLGIFVTVSTFVLLTSILFILFLL